MRTRWNTETFIKYCKEIHNNKYDYSKLIYNTLHNKVIIICRKHGEFLQTANHHKKGHGCPFCSAKNTSLNLRDNTKSFIEKATKIHGNKYLYDKTVYVTAHTKLIISYKVHGDIKVTPNNFLKNGGCIYCGREKTKVKLKSKKVIKSYTRKGWEKICKGREATLYVIKIFNEEESFYKIGMTSRDVNKRFSNLPYNYEVIFIKKSIDPVEIYDLEKYLLKNTKSFMYKPKKDFEGRTECRSNIDWILNNYKECH